MPSTPVKKPSARKSLCLLTNILDIKPKIAKRCFVAAKSRSKAIIVGNSLSTQKKTKRAFKSQRADQMYVYTWITRHPQVFQSPISNDCINFMLGD